MRRRAPLLAAAVLLVSVPALAGTASAEATLSFDGDPAPGAEIEVSGSRCNGFDGDGGGVIGGDVSIEVTGGDPLAVIGTSNFTTEDEPGPWQVLVELSPDAQPGETYTIKATCSTLDNGDPLFFEYPDVTFVMGGTVVPPTPTPTPDTTPGTNPPTAGAAAAVAGQPRFTG
ncbi:MAG: hypothetical protein MUE36_03625 [Acidimicrobiales bacterium]|jgi:hypothetical protein|nr:hypothetical protein [Acidimicrobiales bacterium]